MTTYTMELKIPAATVKALLVIAAKEDIMFYLNGVCIDMADPAHVVLVATDGHRLLAINVARDDRGGDVEHFAGRKAAVIIPRDALSAVKAKGTGRKVEPLTVTLEQDITQDSARPGVTCVSVTRFKIEGATCATGNEVDGRYPDWRRTVPRCITGKTAQFNAGYVGDFQKVHELLSGAYSPHILHNGEGAALVAFPGKDHAMGILMPMRGEPDAKLPAWTGVTLDKAEDQEKVQS